MLNVCAGCGAYRVDREIDPVGPVAVCPECGHRTPFVRSRLSIVSGASGCGKTTICARLTGAVSEAVLLDSDVLWSAAFAGPDSDRRAFFEIWLRVAKNIAQSGRPVVLFGAGIGVPANIEPCIERRYFSTVRYLALTCDEDELRRRLAARPAWRRSNEPAFVEAQVRFNRWFLDRTADGSMHGVDTSHESIDAAAVQVAEWIREAASNDRHASG
jgi:predicted kinase